MHKFHSACLATKKFLFPGLTDRVDLDFVNRDIFSISYNFNFNIFKMYHDVNPDKFYDF